MSVDLAWAGLGWAGLGWAQCDSMIYTELMMVTFPGEPQLCPAAHGRGGGERGAQASHSQYLP